MAYGKNPNSPPLWQEASPEGGFDLGKCFQLDPGLTVFRELISKRADADLKHLGGLCAIAVCLLESIEDGAFLHLVKRHNLVGRGDSIRYRGYCLGY